MMLAACGGGGGGSDARRAPVQADPLDALPSREPRSRCQCWIAFLTAAMSTNADWCATLPRWLQDAPSSRGLSSDQTTTSPNHVFNSVQVAHASPPKRWRLHFCDVDVSHGDAARSGGLNYNSPCSQATRDREGHHGYDTANGRAPPPTPDRSHAHVHRFPDPDHHEARHQPRFFASQEALP